MLIMQGKFADGHGYTFPLIGADWRKLIREAYSLLPESAPKHEGIAYWESAACDGDFPGAPAKPEYGPELAVEIGRLTLGCDDVEFSSFVEAADYAIREY